MVLARRLDKIENVVSKRQKGIAVIIEDVHDPHNAEAIFRTCDAFGVQEVYLIFEKEKAWNPSKIGKQSSSSANKWLTFHIFRSTKECISELKKKGYFVIASTLRNGSNSLLEYSFDKKDVALLIGNEHSGLSNEAIDLADVCLNIPMQGMVESLNVSVATALFLFEISRQRISSGNFKELSLNDRKKLIEEFSIRSSKRMKRT